MSKVIKRDGTTQQFSPKTVVNAILKAQEEVGMSSFAVANIVADKVGMFVSEGDRTVDEIQAVVEMQLKEHQPEVGRAYHRYRVKRDAARESNSPMFKDIANLVIQADALIANENANKDARVFPVQRDLMAGIISKHMGRNHVLPPHIVQAHDSGDIHYHDLDYAPFLPMTNCCLVDLTTLLRDGFRLGNAQIESPKSIGVACAVMAQITAQVASHQYGGTTFANIDEVLQPYVSKSFDKHLERAIEFDIPNKIAYAEAVTKKEVLDGIQAYEYEINTLFTTNGQTPFVTVTFGMGTGKFSRWIQEAILKVRIKGLGKDGITAVFPKLVMFLEKGINLKKEDPNYDIKQLALECSSKRLYPDIISADINRTITKSPVPVSPMGCRSFLGGWKDANGDYTLDGRNNLGVVSVNLPRIAIESGGDFGKFWGVFEGRLALAKEALETRIDSLRGVKASVAPILYTEGAFGVKLHPDDEIIDMFKHGRASISVGYIGIHEVMQLMYPEIEHPLDSPEAQAFGKMVVEQLKATVTRWKDESDEGWGFSLYSTPSESLCDRFCRLDAKKFGIIPGITDKGWYMNSFHFDVDKKVTPFEKIDFEADYHFIASGGHISYAEFPNLRHNLPALEAVWDYAMERLAYFGTNTPSDLCFDCKFEGEFKATSKGFECPKCSNRDSLKMSVIRRVCGYLGAPNSRGFNPGKQQEVIHRVKHIDAEVVGQI
ncbi:MAG: anaerobic ribonucleoside-triphosphate reductase [Aeromonas popoffii]|uniref:anaerobic ribonucleoside-triphosphate reductase n=1 Tax=Aeromonas popoffii TaxID=70856 RepID=UPI003F3F3CD7